ncbi:MAG TPA: hypothetical protein DCS93_10105 [Microscillaceae bacterium]|nr:hypothetical protein [Microscillaceae bacterium]
MQSRYLLLIYVLTVFCSNQLVAQNLTQRISGQIVDAVSRQPIIGATVTVLNTQPLLGGVTSADGRFTIANVPIGRHDVQVSYIGYETVVQESILVTSARVYNLNVLLKETTENLELITIKAGQNKEALNTIAKVSARSFSLEESTRFAGGLSDPSRVAYSFAGVTFGAAQDNGVVIRGNSPTKVLWRIEGVEVPGASHFGGGNLAGAGLITIFSSNVLGTSDFLTGAFPAEYGNATSGVFDVNFRAGSQDQTKYALQLGVLAADVAIEGPLKKNSKASYLVNYRHGFIGYYGRLAGGVAPDYQDVSFKLNLPTAQAGNFSVWGIGGLSSLFSPYQRYKEEEEEDGTIEIEQRETESDFQEDDIDFDMAAVGVRHELLLSKRLLLNSSLAFSTNGYQSEAKWFTPESPTSNNGILSPYTSLQNRESKFTFTSNLSYKFSRGISNTTGIIADYLTYKAVARQANRPEQPLQEFVNTTGNTYYLQAYTQSDFQLTSALSFQVGVNLGYFGINQEVTLEPRAGLSWQFLPAFTLGFGYGRHTRREELKVYFFDYQATDGSIQTNEPLKRLKADHYVASLNWQITPNLRLNIEGYYQRLFDVPVASDSSYSLINYTQLWELDRQLTNDGTGENYGIDVTFEQSFHNNYYYLITTSFFDSKYIGGDGVERNTLFNRGYVTTLTAGKEFVIRSRKKKRLKFLGLNINATYMAGQRNTPFIQDQSIREERVVLDYRRLYTGQNPPELWINYGITYKINKEKSTVTWGLDMQNGIFTEQRQGYEYNFVTNSVQERKVLFLLPNLYYKLEF